MSKGRYTAREIDAMRRAIQAAMTSGFGFGRYSPSAEAVEMRLRTHMENGSRPDELEAIAEEHRRAQAETWRIHKEDCEQRRVDPYTGIKLRVVDDAG